MSILTNLLSLLGNNALIPAVIPSLAFMLASIIVFDPIFKFSALIQQQNGVDVIVGFSLVVVLPVIILSYTLTALNPYILKLFEGYIFFNRFPFMRMAHMRKATKLIKRRETLRQRIRVVEQCEKQTERSRKLLLRLRSEYYSVAVKYEHSYPPSLNDIMPTSIGNIMKASETYAGTRYGIDGVAFWPRLVHVIPNEFKEAIDASRNELSFLVNMSILAIAFFLLCVSANFFNFLNPINNISYQSVVFGNSLRYTIAGLLALFCNWFFNRASMYSVGSFGNMIRSAYDLFRLDLLQQFRLSLPRNSIDEFYIWKNLGELILQGPNSLDFSPLEYDWPMEFTESLEHDKTFEYPMRSTRPAKKKKKGERKK